MLILVVCILTVCTGVLGVTPSSTGRQGHGLIGYGINMYKPFCATACRDSTSSYLYCEDGDSSSHSHMSMIVTRHMDDGDDDDDAHSGMEMNSTLGIATMMPSPACKSTNVAWLQSIAYCISTHCDESISIPDREAWWFTNMIGAMPDQPLPVMSYQTTLASIHTPPNSTASEDDPISSVVLVDEDSYESNRNAGDNFQRAETWHSKTSIILFILSVGLPIALSFLRFIPFPPAITSRFRAHIIDAPLVQRPVKLPLFGRVSTITRGQFLFVTYLVSINIILNSVGYRAIQPNAWWSTKKAEITAYIANRSGAMSFANIPVLILFAGRNNILLWLTGWSYSTFLLLHKCVAILATIEACLHSAMYVNIDLVKGTFSEESKLPYWILGIVATLAMSLLLPLSIRRFRQSMYELFLIVHIVLAIGTIVGCWYHIVWRFDRQWGYELWIYVAIAIWTFDRIARIGRIARNGHAKALVYRIDEDYLRIDIPGIAADGYIFIHFLSAVWEPTLTPRPWESHPFSVAAVNRLPPSIAEHDLKILETPGSEMDSFEVSSSHTVAPVSATLLVRVQKGITTELMKHAAPIHGKARPFPISILVESSYGTHKLLPEMQLYPSVVLIAGGVGITSLLPFISTAAHSMSRRGTMKLFWSNRTAGLVESVEELMTRTGTSDDWGLTEKTVVIGERLHLEEVIRGQGSDGQGVLVIVSGPVGMAEEVRRVVTRRGQEGALIKLVEESFDW